MSKVNDVRIAFQERFERPIKYLTDRQIREMLIELNAGKTEDKPALLDLVHQEEGALEVQNTRNR